MGIKLCHSHQARHLSRTSYNTLSSFDNKWVELTICPRHHFSSNTAHKQYNQKQSKINMKLSSSALFTLSSSLGIVASVQPPPYGYGDPYCPHDSCLQVTNTGLRGARSTLYNCYDQSTGKSISPWTGSNTEPPEGWTVPSNCDDTGE